MPRGSTPASRQPPVESERRAFLDACRTTSRERYDTIHAARYDEDWGLLAASHVAALDALLSRTRPGGTILDAACGTGKYWPGIQASGRTVVGTDQSSGMLAQARRKHPDVPTATLGLQELAFHGLFDAVICVDALENVGPEDWPRVIERLAAAARPQAPMWLTVELADPSAIAQAYESALVAGQPVVEGEVHDGIGYHYYPTKDRVFEWLFGAGLTLLEESEGDEYWHLLLRRDR
jgi:cyclopropane fatty-acyl-phospholipid synthase-like methyltransferase